MLLEGRTVGTGGIAGTREGAWVGKDGRVGDIWGAVGGSVCSAPVEIDCRDGRNREML